MGLLDGLIASLPDAKGSAPSAKSSAGGGGEIESLLRNKAAEYDIDPDLFVSLAKRESGLRPDAKNPGSTAGGLFQFIDGTWNRYGNKKDKFDPEANADAAARMLRDHLGMFEGDYSKALAAHHVGSGKAAKALTDRGVGDKDVSTQQWLSDIFKGAGRDNPLAKPLGAFADAEAGVGGYDQIRRGQIAQAESDESPVSTSLKRGMKGLTHSAGLAVDNMLGDSDGAAQRIIDKQAFDQATPAPSSVQKFGRDWDALAEDDYSGMFGTILKNPAGSFNMMLEQTPNSLPGMAFQTIAGVAGRGLMALGPVGAAAGLGLQGLSAFAGNFLPEGGAFIEEQLHKSGVDTNDVRAVAKWIEENRGKNFKGGATKAGVISAVDGVTGWMGMKMLAGPSVRFAKAEKDFFAKNGVNVTDSAALQAARAGDAYKAAMQPFAADLVKATEGFGMLKRGVGATALDAMGEGVGEYAGTYAATGDASIKDAVLEGVMGVGQGAAMAGAGYGIGKLSGPDQAMEELRKLATANIAPAEAKPNSPLSNAAQAAQSADPITEALKPISERFADRTLYDQIRSHPNLGPDAMNQILSAYRVATNTNMDPMARQAAVERLGEFFRLFDNQPNFTMGTGESAPEQASKPGALLSGPDGAESESQPPLIDPLSGRLIGGPSAPALMAPAEEDIAAKRAALLDRVLATNPENPNRTFDRALRLEGFRDSAFTDAEKERIAQFAAMRSSPISANGLTPMPSQGRYQHLSDMLDAGWESADRGRLVGPNGETYNLKGAGEAQFVRNKLNQKAGNGNQSPRGGAQGGTDQGDFGVGSAGANGPVPQGGGNGSGQANALPDTRPADGAVSEAEATGVGSQPNNSLARSRLTALEDPRIAKYADELRSMAPDSGWAEEGGRLLIAPDGTKSRTKWIPRAEWFVAGMLNSPQESVAAVEKAISGQPMRKAEKLHVQGMMDFLDMQHGIDGESHAEQLATLSDIAYEGESADAQNIIDTLGDVDLESNGAWGDEVESMRALGFTEEEINEITRRKQGAFGAVGEEASGVPAGETQGAIPEGDGNGDGQAEGQEGFSLSQQTNEEAAEQFAQQEAGDSNEITKEQADKERDAVPFSMQTQSQPKPQGTQVGLFTADGRPTVAAKQPETVKRKIFRDNKAGVREVHEVDAQDVSISELPNHQFFVFKDEESGAYSLTEASTGLRVGVGETAESAIADFKGKLEKIGADTFAKRVADSPKIQGAESTTQAAQQSAAQRSFVRTYKTKSGKIGARIEKVVGPTGKVFYNYTGEWGAGSGHALAQMDKIESMWRKEKRGYTVVEAEAAAKPVADEVPFKDGKASKADVMRELAKINEQMPEGYQAADGSTGLELLKDGKVVGNVYGLSRVNGYGELLRIAKKLHAENAEPMFGLDPTAAPLSANQFSKDAPVKNPATMDEFAKAVEDGYRAHYDFSGTDGRTIWIQPTANGWTIRWVDDEYPGTTHTKGAAGAGAWDKLNAINAAKAQVEYRFNQWKPLADSAPSPVDTSMRDTGAKAFADGLPRVAPEGIKGADKVRWLTGYDSAKNGNRERHELPLNEQLEQAERDLETIMAGVEESGYVEDASATDRIARQEKLIKDIKAEIAASQQKTDNPETPAANQAPAITPETNAQKSGSVGAEEDLEKRITIAADSIDKLRKVDVERVLMQGNLDRQAMADYIKRNRPELSAEVDGVMAESNQPEAVDSDFERGKAMMGEGIDKLISLLGGKTNMLPEEETQIIPVMSQIFRGAALMGYAKFKEASRFVLDTLRAKSPEVADKIDIENLQAGYINAMKSIEGASTKAEIIEFDSVDQLYEERAKFQGRIAAAEQRTALNPTEAQKESGIYAKGKFAWKGMTISIETPKWAERSGTDEGGQRWSITAPTSYGYFLGTTAADKEHLDVYIGDKPESDRVYVINQTKVDSPKFDEHKILIGFDSEEGAKQAYFGAFSEGFAPRVFGSMAGPFSVDEFKAMLPKLEKSRFIEDRVADKSERLNRLPDGWNGTVGGIATNKDPVRGGIVDKTIATGEWFYVPHDESLETVDGFKSQQEAIDALQKAVEKRAKYLKTTEKFKEKQAERAIVPLDQITVTRSATLDGKAVEYDQQADEALKEIDGNMDLAKRLLECLAA